MTSFARIAAVGAALIVSGAAALALSDRGVQIAPDTPVRAHRVLGPVMVVSDLRPPGAAWTELHAPRLAAEARARYGHVDAIADTRHAPLPNGAGAVTTGRAVIWN